MENPDILTKRCSRCAKELPQAEFHQDKSRPDGLKTWCKACSREHKRSYSQANRAKINATYNQYYEKNKESIGQSHRQSYAKHREKWNAYDRERWEVRGPARNAERRAEYAENPEVRQRNLDQNQEYRRQHPEYFQEYERDKRPERDPVSKKKWRHTEHIKGTYGLSSEDYNRMFDEQGGVCAICGKNGKRKLAVDHCHKTGAVRKLLCGRCNTGLGMLKDDPELVAKALEYLKAHES